jgi:hypothetical protein
MGLAGGNHVVVRTLLLQHHPQRLDVIACKTPVPARIQITQRQLFLQPNLIRVAPRVMKWLSPSHSDEDRRFRYLSHHLALQRPRNIRMRFGLGAISI